MGRSKKGVEILAAAKRRKMKNDLTHLRYMTGLVLNTLRENRHVGSQVHGEWVMKDMSPISRDNPDMWEAHARTLTLGAEVMQELAHECRQFANTCRTQQGETRDYGQTA